MKFEELSEYQQKEYQEISDFVIAVWYQGHAYCLECALDVAFNGDLELLLEALGEKLTLRAADGSPVETENENSIQYESFPFDYLPNGLECTTCGSELIEGAEERDITWY